MKEDIDIRCSTCFNSKTRRNNMRQCKFLHQCLIKTNDEEKHFRYPNLSKYYSEYTYTYWRPCKEDENIINLKNGIFLTDGDFEI